MAIVEIGSVLVSFSLVKSSISEIDKLLAQLLDHSIVVGLALVVLIDHVDATLFIVPLDIRLKTNLLPSLVSREEGEVCGGVQHVDQSFHSQEEGEIFRAELLHRLCHEHTFLDLLVLLNLLQLVLDVFLERLLFGVFFFGSLLSYSRGIVLLLRHYRLSKSLSLDLFQLKAKVFLEVRVKAADLVNKHWRGGDESQLKLRVLIDKTWLNMKIFILLVRILELELRKLLMILVVGICGEEAKRTRCGFSSA